MPHYEVRPLEILTMKEKLFSQFKEELSDIEIERALRDPHAKRSPRWCGITVHVTVNCPFACSYCYIENMGFRFSNPKPYPLSGKELAFALLSNKTFLPGRTGSLIAIGSVSEPFIFQNKALEYLEWLGRLGNPLQFSTKQYISPSLAEKIAEISEKYGLSISPLITIVTITKADVLEKQAPPPDKRLDSIKNLRDAGLRPILFLRPVIPGINVEEIPLIIREAKKAGAYGVVVGGFRVTKTILERLENAGLDTLEIRRRLKKIDEKQRAVPFPEKKSIIENIRKQDLVAWASTCCANSWTAEVPCPSACFIDGPCTKCPNGCLYPYHVPSLEETVAALEKLGIRAIVREDTVYLPNRTAQGIAFLVRTISRRRVKIRRK